MTTPTPTPQPGPAAPAPASSPATSTSPGKSAAKPAPPAPPVVALGPLVLIPVLVTGIAVMFLAEWLGWVWGPIVAVAAALLVLGVWLWLRMRRRSRGAGRGLFRSRRSSATHGSSSRRGALSNLFGGRGRSGSHGQTPGGPAAKRGLLSRLGIHRKGRSAAGKTGNGHTTSGGSSSSSRRAPQSSGGRRWRIPIPIPHFKNRNKNKNKNGAPPSGGGPSGGNQNPNPGQKPNNPGPKPTSNGPVPSNPGKPPTQTKPPKPPTEAAEAAAWLKDKVTNDGQPTPNPLDRKPRPAPAPAPQHDSKGRETMDNNGIAAAAGTTGSHYAFIEGLRRVPDAVERVAADVRRLTAEADERQPTSHAIAERLAGVARRVSHLAEQTKGWNPANRHAESDMVAAVETPHKGAAVEDRNDVRRALNETGGQA